MRSHHRRVATRAAAALAVVAAASSLTAAVPAGAVTDRPNTYAQATRAAVSQSAVALYSTIDSRTDQDWFKFTVTATTKAAVTLGSLPGNYSLAVYDGAGRRVGLSAYTGTHFERVILTVGAGTYYVRVATQGDYSRTKRYMLRFRPLPPGLVTLDQYKGPTGGAGIPSRVAATIFNNTPTWQWIPEVDYTWYDKNHRALRHDTGGMDLLTWLVPPYSSMPFAWHGNMPPAGATSVSVKANGTQVRTPATPPAIRVSGVAMRYVVTRYGNFTRITGTASSPSSRRFLGYVEAEAYNANGTLMEASNYPVNIGGGRTERFTLDVYSARPNAIRMYGLVDRDEPVPVQ